MSAKICVNFFLEMYLYNVLKLLKKLELENIMHINNYKSINNNLKNNSK